MQDRREWLKSSAAVAALLAGLGPRAVWAQAGWNKAAFEAKSLGDAVKALGGGQPTPSSEVVLQAPDIAENGAVVPIAATVSAAGVKRVLLLVEKNPNALAGVFELTDAVEPAVRTNVKMGQTSNVYAVAITADNKVLYAEKEVKVTLGGCGG
jgi:sulfur-oxidizing protein SoxY